MKITNKLGTGTLNKHWNVFYFYFGGYSIQMCNKYKDFYLSINCTSYVFKTDTEVVSFISSIN